MADVDDKYHLVVGLTFLFNLLLGTGVLTMPAVFGAAGWVSALVVVTLLCAMSYKEAGNLVESMANANFINRITPHPLTTNGRKETANADDFESSALLFYSSDQEEIEDDNDNNEVVLSNDNVINDSNTDDKERVQLRHNSTAQNPLLSTPIDDMSSVLGSVSRANASVNNQNGKVGDDDDGGIDNPMFDGDEEEEGLKKEIKSGPDMVEVNYGLNDNNENRSVQDQLRSIRQYFEINNKYELGDMCELFLGSLWVKFFFASIIIYLLGDLMIYNTMLAKSTREVTCTAKLNCSADASHQLDAPCWSSLSVSRRNMYRAYLLMFVAVLLPLTYAGLKKTSFIQIITIVLRWLAFIAMVGITIKIFIMGQATGRPKLVDLSNVPKMFGICVYAFMCHHSVPSILTPIRHKRNLNRGLTIDYLLVYGLYVLVALTAVFAFEHVQDVYTLNFQINDCPSGGGGGSNTTESNPGNVPVLDYFLPTYPIFTLFSSYTMIALTLINNMKVLAKNWCDITTPLLHFTFPLMAMVPPMLVALFTEDVSAVVSYVGSYAGGLIQYVFPSILVYRSRQQTKARLVSFIREKYPHLDSSTLSEDEIYVVVNPFASPFQHNIYLIITGAWWLICLLLVSYDHIIDLVHKSK